MQEVFEGMPRRLYAASPARLATYLDCPRRYRFGYLDRPRPAGTPWARRTVGAAVHVALARWWSLPRTARTPVGGGALLAQAWRSDGFRDAEQSLRARDRARQDVERYLSGVDPAAEPVAVERTMVVRTGRASLWGRVDRLDRRGERLVVVDYKTGRTASDEQDAAGSLALAVYAAAAARALRRACSRVELHHVPTGGVAAFEHTSQSLKRHLDAADAVSAELDELDERHRSRPAGMSRAEADAAFPARVAPRCGGCDFRAVCGPGSVVPPLPSWTGVDGD